MTSLQLSKFESSNRKVDPRRRTNSLTKPDGTPLDNDRIEVGPTDLAFKEWEEQGIIPPNLEELREYRLSRVVEQLQSRDYDGLLCFDPINIRYVSDSSNMNIWMLHNKSRACFVSAEGYIIIWDFKGCEHMNNHLSLVKEVRTGAGFYYFVAGDKSEERAKSFVDQIDDIMKEHGSKNKRLAVDQLEIHGIKEFQKRGYRIEYGQEVMEQARAIKNNNEIKAMKCAINTCETAMHKMREGLSPGMAEVDVWAILQHENFIRGGEWIETRILSSGPRTNPWYQECGPRIMQEGEFLGFDTDMISTYGYCADISRTWLIGDKKPSVQQKSLYCEASDFLRGIIEAIKPGMSLKEASLACPQVPEKYFDQRYAVLLHGVGLCDEFPEVIFPQFVDQAYSGTILPGMTLCAEVYFGEVNAPFGVKLEEQILITDSGIEKLSSYPLEKNLLE